MTDDALVLQRDRELASVETALCNAGILVDSVYHLERNPEFAKRAVPIILSLWPEIKSNLAKHELVSALLSSMPANFLIKELQSIHPEIANQNPQAKSLGWTLANALCEVPAADVFDQMLRIWSDRSYGTTRRLIADALAKVKGRREEVVEALEKALPDAEVTWYALDNLGKLKAVEKIEAIKPYLGHPSPPIRKQATKVLKKLGALPKAKKPIAAASSPASPEDRETSLNLDEDDIPSFFRGIGEIVDGIGEQQITALVEHIEDMEVDDTSHLEIPVVFRGQPQPLGIGIFLDDVGAPDVTLIATAPLIAEIETFMDRWLEEHEAEI